VKIILVNPPPRKREFESIVVPPLGLLYIGTALKNAGFEVAVKDAFAERMTWDGFESYIAAEKADVLGLGGMTPVIDSVFRAARIARPHVKHIVIGGPHVSLYRNKVFDQCPAIDFGVVGEGEITVVELLCALRDGRSVAGIKGVTGRGVANPERELMADIDGIPLPDRGMLRNHLYTYPLLKYPHATTMFTSRGCPYSCAFCDKSTFGSVWRPRQAGNVLEEITEIVNRFGIRSIVFYDDLFTVKKERVMDICEGILKKGFKIDWKCEGRVNLVDREILGIMKKAGCSTVAYGVESANQHGLDYLNKKTSVEQIRGAFAATREAGLRTMAYFILGIPTETFEDELRTIEFAREIRADYAQFSVLSPYYGTKVYEDAVNKGWYAEVNAGNPVDKDLKRAVILSPNWTEESLRAILREAHRRFYFRVRYLAGRLFGLRSAYQAWVYIRIFLRICFWMKA
jgi:radical SAM superfamily enzyme YgiQ (UPF0313 family)